MRSHNNDIDREIGVLLAQVVAKQSFLALPGESVRLDVLRIVLQTSRLRRVQDGLETLIETNVPPKVLVVPVEYHDPDGPGGSFCPRDGQRRHPHEQKRGNGSDGS